MNVKNMQVKNMKAIRLFRYALNGVILSAAVVSGGCTITDVTSSTSGSLDTVTPDISLNRFIDVRLASIQKEAAQGEGENLDALAELMGKNDKQAFSLMLHSNYDNLFGSLEKPSQLITRIEILENDLM